MNDRPPSRIRYTVGLQEAVVERLLRGRREAGDHAPYERYRKAADRLYIQHVDPESRLVAFRVLYARLFEELGCAKAIEEVAAGLAGRIADVLVSRAWTPSEEGAELSADKRTLGLRLLPVRFTSPVDLERFLCHEMERITDMLDESFGYGAGLGEGAVRRRSMAERFGFLWDCSIDGRTARAGRAPWRTPEEYEETCRRLFPVLAPVAAAVVGRLWDGERPDYPMLVQMTAGPAALAAWAGVAQAEEVPGSGLQPGMPCPLCGFPTHAWAASFDPQVVRLIQADFPTWQARQGACERCVEGYAVRLMLSR